MGRDAVLVHLTLQFFIDQPLMRGVLVYDDHATGGLRDDVILMHLPPRGAERVVRGGGRLFALGRGSERRGRFGHRRALHPAPDACGFGKARRLRVIGRLPRGGAGAVHARAVHLVDPCALRFGLHRAQSRLRYGGRCAVPRLGQRMAQGRDDQPPRQTGIAETHLGFRGMHVYIDQRWRAFHEQRRRRVAVAAEEIEIGPAQRACQQFVPHRAAINEKILRHRRATRVGRQCCEAGQMQPFAHGVDGQGVFRELSAQHLRQAAMKRLKQIALLGLGAEHITALTVPRDIAQHEAHEGFGHGQPLDDIADGLRLGPVGAQELESRRCGEKQIAQGDDGAAVQRRRAYLAHAATVDGDLGPVKPRCSAGDGQPPDST